MAWSSELKDTNDRPYFQLAAGTTGALDLGNAMNGPISSWIFQLNVNGSTVALIPKARIWRALAANTPLVSINYQKLDANPIDISGTAISTDGMYVVRSDGMAITLDVPTTHTGGSGIIVYPVPLLG